MWISEISQPRDSWISCAASLECLLWLALHLLKDPRTCRFRHLSVFSVFSLLSNALPYKFPSFEHPTNSDIADLPKISQWAPCTRSWRVLPGWKPCFFTLLFFLHFPAFVLSQVSHATSSLVSENDCMCPVEYLFIFLRKDTSVPVTPSLVKVAWQGLAQWPSG